MKTKIISFSVCLYFGIVSLISASQEINETQMEPIRKAGIHIEYTNFESNFVIFDVRQKAQTIRTIKHRLNLNQKKTLNRIIIENFFKNQFDAIKITKDNLIITSPENQERVPYNNGIFWCNSNLSVEQFSCNLNNYLNKFIKKPAQKLLNKSLRQNKIENCYAIGIHIPKLNGVIDIIDVSEDSDNGERNSVSKYQSLLEIQATATLLIYRLDKKLNKFVQCSSFENSDECYQLPITLEIESIIKKVDYKIVNTIEPEVFNTMFQKLSVALGERSKRMAQCCFPNETDGKRSFFAYLAIGVDESGGNEASNRHYKKFQFGLYKECFSDIWLELAGSYGKSNEYFDYQGINYKIDAKYYSANFNIYYRLFNLDGFFIKPGTGIEYRYTTASDKYYDIETDNMILKYILNCGYTFPSGPELFLSFAYNVMYNYRDYEGIDKTFNDLITEDSGIAIHFGLAF